MEGRVLIGRTLAFALVFATFFGSAPESVGAFEIDLNPCTKDACNKACQEHNYPYGGACYMSIPKGRLVCVCNGL